jgi:hypothetical protein
VHGATDDLGFQAFHIVSIRLSPNRPAAQLEYAGRSL